MTPTITVETLGDKKDKSLVLLQEIATEGYRFEHDEPQAREKLIESARSLICSLETPMESILWMIWCEVRIHLLPTVDMENMIKV